MFSVMIPLAYRFAYNTQYCQKSKTYYTKNIFKFRAACITGVGLITFLGVKG